MLAQYFAQNLLLLSPSHSLSDAMEWSKNHFLYDVPILNDQKLLGYLNLKSIDLEISTKTLIADFISGIHTPICVFNDEHIFDALLKLQFQDCLVVLDTQGKYSGTITIHQIPEIFKYLQLSNFKGETLVLAVHYRDYSLSEISRIAESCNAKIVSVFLSQHPDENKLYVNLKFNMNDLSRLVSAYERFGYEVAYVNQHHLSLTNATANYESLMKYLEI
jgi:hypothetical protein